MWQRWPDQPPYGGAFADIVPHLTVAVGEEGLGEIERELMSRLPIAARATEAWLIADVAPGRWTRQRTFRLGGPQV